MSRITDNVSIDESDFQLEFVRASGPGGQNVNKVSTRCSFVLTSMPSPPLPEEMRIRLSHLARRRINREGILIIQANRYRSQEQNREDAVNRLVALLRAAAEKPKSCRRNLEAPLRAKLNRLEAKRRLSEKKRLRRQDSYEG